jgi:hypothetical protein
MVGACLDLLIKRVHVAEALLERTAREDRVDARSLAKSPSSTAPGITLALASRTRARLETSIDATSSASAL